MIASFFLLWGYSFTMRKKSWFGNLFYCLHDVYLYNKLAIFALVLYILTTICTAILSILLTYYVVQYLEAGASATAYLSLIGIFSLSIFASTALMIWSQNYYSWNSTFARCFTSWIRINEKILRTDYLNVEPRDKRAILMKGFRALDSNWIGIESMMKQAPDLAIGLLGILLYATISAVYVPWILTVMVAMIITSALWAQWSKSFVTRSQSEYEKNYTLGSTLTKNTTNLENAKDVRAYRMKPWFDTVYEALSHKVFVLETKTQFRIFMNEANNCVFLFLRDLVAYLLLLPQVIDGKISLAIFAFLIGIIAGFSTWVNTFIAAFDKCQIQSPLVSDYRDALQLKDAFNHEKGLDITSLDKPFEITFDHVSFRYPGAEKNVLNDINLSIKPGEKIAIVGNNGAGKTTLIKLLCGLYQPTEGSIALDGHDIKEFNHEDYMSLISALFQDVHPMAFTIKMNIGCTVNEDIDETRLQDAMQKSGIAEKVATLKDKENTFITQAFSLTGIQLSGGETQKLLLARALYKNPPLLVLDEPTAALDPLSEEAMYKQYLSFANGNTSIFISHRLASTRFCDRIVFMENGTIKNVGTHENLLALDKDYREMFDLQAKYYRDETGGETNGQDPLSAVL